MPIWLLTFIKSKWLVYALAAAGIASALWLYGANQHQKGFTEGEGKERQVWQKWYVEETEKYAKRVKDIEALSRLALEDANNKIALADVKIDMVLEQQQKPEVRAKVNTVVYNKQAQPVLECPEQEIYLGNTFSEEWNRLNEAIK